MKKSSHFKTWMRNSATWIRNSARGIEILKNNQMENLDMKSSIKQIKIEIIDQAKERI
jgi:hypothetical protein